VPKQKTKNKKKCYKNPQTKVLKTFKEVLPSVFHSPDIPESHKKKGKKDGKVFCHEKI
jgi:hypothetical protein